METQMAIAQIIGRSSAIMAEVEKLERYARSTLTVLICGETGTGKEVFANAIHVRSLRAAHSLLPVNCSSMSPELLENELFGHEAGAYTGANGSHKGVIEQAKGGTLFLDEIDSFPISSQPKLLRFLEEGEYRPLGASSNRKANVRVISASNRNLEQCVASGEFREDLYHRLNILVLWLPPLRERREDIPLLARHFIAASASNRGRTNIRLTTAALEKLANYHWPGNVRQLKNIIDRSLVLCSGEILDEIVLELPAGSQPERCTTLRAKAASGAYEAEDRELRKLLAQHRGNLTHAAKALGVDLRNFRRRVRKTSSFACRLLCKILGRDDAQYLPCLILEQHICALQMKCGNRIS